MYIIKPSINFTAQMNLYSVYAMARLVVARIFEVEKFIGMTWDATGRQWECEADAS
jgi:hypothetical protein